MNALMDDVTDAPLDTPCRQAPDLWFPRPGDNARDVKAHCEACPAIHACLDAALDFEGLSSRAARHGIWAGMTPQERADLAALRRAESGVAA